MCNKKLCLSWLAVVVVSFLGTGTGALRAEVQNSQNSLMDSDWEPTVEFSDKNSGNLAIRVNPKSPGSCGVNFLEVGVNDPRTGKFQPHMALLRDLYDESYPGIAPKIRRIYSYDMPVQLRSNLGPAKDSPLRMTMPMPPVIVDADEFRKQVMAKLLYTLTSTIVTSLGNPIASSSALTVDQFVQYAIKKRTFYRAQAIYMLKLIQNSPNPELRKHFLPGELERLIAVGADADYKDVLISKDYQDFAYMAQNDAIRQARVTNFANLLSALNREGLVAQPLFRDFVMVYYDPSKRYARKIDLEYSDLEVSPESALLRKRAPMTKNGLLPLGIYAIGHSADRLLQYDFLKPERISKRVWAQYYTRLGHDMGTAFIPFPFSLLIRATKLGVEFVLTKSGQDVLTDTVKTEGELLALLNSGVAKLDPALIAQVKSHLESSKEQALLMNDMLGLLRSEKGGAQISAYRRQNEVNLTAYLSSRSASLCKEIAALREGEFRSEYLTVGESIERRFEAFFKFFGFSSDLEYAAERRQIIQERRELFEARRVLDKFDPFIKFTDNSKLIHALNVIAQAKEEDDVALLSSLMKKFVDPALLSATMKAAMVHGNGNLAASIAGYLESFNIDMNYGVPFAIEDAINAIAKLDMKSADDPDEAIEGSLRVLNLLLKSPNRTVRFLANESIYWVANQKVTLHHL